MDVILVTSCSNRKTIPLSRRVSSESLPYGSLTEISLAWKNLLNTDSIKIKVRDLYCGRGFSEAKKAADQLNAEHWIISAGLGLVHVDHEVSAYDLTVSGQGHTSIRPKISDSPFNAEKWWNELSNNIPPLSTLIKSKPDSLIIFAVPTNYFQMVSADLESLTTEQLQRVRIIGPTITSLSNTFQSLRLPYDYRLDGPNSPIPGTRSDFPQRAAHHFAQHIWPKSKAGTTEKHIHLVNLSMGKMEYPSIPNRTRKTDSEITELIIKNWKKSSGFSTRMHRILRDEELVSCEQKRFRKLFHNVKQLGEQYR